MPSSTSVAECLGEPVEGLNGRRLWDIFAGSANAHPQNEAVVSLWQSPLRWTYSDLLQRSEALAAWLAAPERGGCGDGDDPVVVLLGNAAEWAVFFWASLKLGVPFVPIDPRLLLADARALVETLGDIKPKVVVVANAKARIALDEAAEMYHSETLRQAKVLIQLDGDDGASCEDEDDNDVCLRWTELSLRGDDMMMKNTTLSQAQPLPPQSDTHANTPTLIVFTSGTTSNPKGCLHTDASLWSQMHDYDPQPATIYDRWLVHTPLSHIFAINNCLRAWRRGDCVVLASEVFDVTATLTALLEERCTFMSAVPTLVKALLAHPGFQKQQRGSGLAFVTMGGTVITEADVRLCKKEEGGLGARDAVQAFGMSEGAPLVSWIRGDEALLQGRNLGVGKVLPGANIRICCAPAAADNGDKNSSIEKNMMPLARNEVGELHIGGTSVIRGYLAGVAKESFYEDHIGHWMRTGDQAMIDEEGVLHILGRYKDVIIRAGENIAPSTIETVLSKMDGVVAQVVGIPDETAGQVPVAIAKLPTKAQLSQAVGSSLGPMYSLDSVYTLEELGLKAFPMTVTGKIRKDKLAEAVLKHRGLEVVHQTKREGNNLPITHDDLVSQLGAIIGGLVGAMPSPDADVLQLMDSVSILRYCDRVLRQTGRRLYLQDVLQHPTLTKQASLLLSRGSPIINTTTVSSVTNQKPPSNPTLSDDQEQALRKVLDYLSVPWVDDSVVEDIIPIKASFARFVTAQRPQTYRHRTWFHCQRTPAPQLRHALEVALTAHPILRSVQIGKTDHAILIPAVIFPHMITEIALPAGTFSPLELDAIKQDDAAAAFHPYLTTQAQIVTVGESGSDDFETHLGLTHSHAVFDVLSILPFHRELDQMLLASSKKNGATLSPPPPTALTTPFKRFAELHRDYADSKPARASIEATAHRLRGLSKMQAALWPRQRTEGWMIGSDHDSPLATRRAATRQRLWQQQDKEGNSNSVVPRHPRIARVVHLPAAAGLAPSQAVAVAALAVLNSRQTGCPYALFNTVDAGRRTWPFVPAWMDSVLPPVMSVDGPTAEWVLQLLQVNNKQEEESVEMFVARVARELEVASEHAHAPWDRVLEALGSEEARIAQEAVKRQTFVWDVTLPMMMMMMRGSGTDYAVMRPEARYDWPDCGLYWNCCALDQHNLCVVASWDTAQLSGAEVERLCDEYAEVLRKMTEAGNQSKRLVEVLF